MRGLTLSAVRTAGIQTAPVGFCTSCASGLGPFSPVSSVFSSRVFPENFFSHSSSDQTATAKGRVRAEQTKGRARAQSADRGDALPSQLTGSGRSFFNSHGFGQVHANCPAEELGFILQRRKKSTTKPTKR